MIASMRIAVTAAMITLFAVLAHSSIAADFPNRPLRVIVTYAAGGGTDMVARLVSQRLSEQLQREVVVENRPGAAGAIAVQHFLRSKPDGHTILFGSAGEFTINPHFFKSLPYNPERDLKPLSIVAEVDVVVVVPTDSPINSLQELIATAKARPGELNYAHPSVGSPHHLMVETFKLMTGANIKAASYNKTRQALTDLVAGRLDVMFVGIPPAMKLVKGGRLKPLATGGMKRSRFFKEQPAVNEILPGYAFAFWWGMLTHAGTPKDVQEVLSREIAAAAKAPKVSARLLKVGMEPTGTTSEEMGKRLKKDSELYRKAIQKLGISAG